MLSVTAGNTGVPLLYLNPCKVLSYSPFQNLHRGEAVQRGGRAPTQLDTFYCIRQWLQTTKIQEAPLLGPNKRQYLPSQFRVLWAARGQAFSYMALEEGPGQYSVQEEPHLSLAVRGWVDKVGQPHLNHLGVTLKTRMWMAELLRIRVSGSRVSISGSSSSTSSTVEVLAATCKDPKLPACSCRAMLMARLMARPKPWM